MNNQNQKFLIETYPILYQNFYKDCTETCMCWGFECDDGWYDILHTLSYILSTIQRVHDYDFKIVADQVKEKYGTLRYYWHVEGDCPNWLYKIIEELVDVAEKATHHTCEICGVWADKQTKGYIQTVCDEHYRLLMRGENKREY